jgi:hypothetical protein
VDGGFVLDSGERTEIACGFESSEMLAVKCAALFTVNERALVVNADDTGERHRPQSVIAGARIITD